MNMVRLHDRWRCTLPIACCREPACRNGRAGQGIYYRNPHRVDTLPGFWPRVVVGSRDVRRPAQQVAQVPLDDRGHLVDGDVAAELLGQGCDAGVGDAARHEHVVPAQVNVAVQREAVHGDAAADPDAEGRDLAFGAPVIGTQPDTAATRDAGRSHAEIGADMDQGLFQPAHVVDDEHVVGQPHDRVADELTRPVERDLAATVHVDYRDPGGVATRTLVRLGALAGGEHRGVLEEQHRVGSTGYDRLVHLALEVPGGEVLDRGVADADALADEVVHGDEPNAVVAVVPPSRRCPGGVAPGGVGPGGVGPGGVGLWISLTGVRRTSPRWWGA